MVKKISELGVLTTADATDVLATVDVSANTTKQVTVGGLAVALATSFGAGTLNGSKVTDATITTAKQVVSSGTSAGMMSTVASLTTSWQSGASVTLPSVTQAHKYLINATFVFTDLSGVETSARIAQGSTNIQQSYVLPAAGFYTPLPITCVFTSSATGGQTINFQALRSNGTGGGLAQWWSHYSIVDLGCA